MESTGVRRFKRLADGAIGVGFVQHGSGRKTVAVAWPEGEPRRYEYQDLAGYGVEDLDVEAEAAPSDSSGQQASSEDSEGSESGSIDQQQQQQQAPSAQVDEDKAIEEHLKAVGLDVTNRSVVEALREKGITIQSGQVTAAKERLRAQA
jgi:hypothetical protein